MSYARVRPVGYNYKEAKFEKANYKKIIRNPDAWLYLALKRMKKISPKLSYKKWLRSDRNYLRSAV